MCNPYYAAECAFYEQMAIDDARELRASEIITDIVDNSDSKYSEFYEELMLTLLEAVNRNKTVSDILEEYSYKVLEKIEEREEREDW